MDLLATARAACADALALAKLQRDGRAWAVVAWPSALDDQLFASFAAAAGRGRTLLWHEGEWLLGIGEAASVSIDGPGRGSFLAQEMARLECRCVVAHARSDARADGDSTPTQRRPALPCFLTSFTFEDRAPGPSHWGHHLPAGRLWLPRRLLWKRGDGSGWTVAALAINATDGDPLRLAERLLAEPEAVADTELAAWPQLTTDYAEQVEDAVSLIHDGAMRKVVLARAIDEPIARDLDAGAVLARLRELGNAESTIYAQDVAGSGLFVGASPELLFAANGLHVSTMALAGSSARGASPIDDAKLTETLMSSTKERKEHGVVVEHLVSVLRPRCAPFSLPSAPHPRYLARLIHLETLVSAELRQADYLELLNALHPTPAVCGLPTATAAHYLARHEKLHRGLYAGVLGWLTPQRCRFIVPLRGGILHPEEGRARLFAGAGIVETSEPSDELAETELKFSLMRQALGIAATAAGTS